MYVYVHVCMCVCVYVHVHVCAYVSVCVPKRARCACLRMVRAAVSHRVCTWAGVHVNVRGFRRGGLGP